MLKKLFFCENCRKKVDSIDQLYFVEDMSDRGFCCENCIKEFYRPYMEMFEFEENKLRESKLLDDEEDLINYLADATLLTQSIRFPEEVWLEISELGQKFFTHIKPFSYDGQRFTIILICSYVDGSPSFVYYRTITAVEGLVNEYRKGEKLVQLASPSANEDNYTHSELPTDQLEVLDAKKSLFLAELLTDRSEDDISIEKFIEFEMYMDLTVNAPDEVYLCEDPEGDDFYVNIKSFKNGEMTFFYFVITFPLNNDIDKQIPILGFPSIDKELYFKYTQIGKSIKQQIKN